MPNNICSPDVAKNIMPLVETMTSAYNSFDGMGGIGIVIDYQSSIAISLKRIADIMEKQNGV